MSKYNVEKVWESGTVDTLRNEEISSSTIRVCSHHIAKIGTIIMVTNPVNKKSVFVKVVANHQLTAGKGDIIQLSSTARISIGIEIGGKVETSFAR